MSSRRELFDEWAVSYDHSVSAGFPFEGYGEALERLFVSAEPPEGQTVLDLGSGAGAVSAMFVAAGCRVTGIDFSAQMIDIARAHLPQARFFEADILGSWPAGLKSCEFDLIVSGYLFHEFEDSQKVRLLSRLREFHKGSGSRVLIADIAFASEELRTECRTQWRHVWDEEEHYWAMDALQGPLASAGFRADFTPVSFCSGVIEVVPVG